MRLEDRECYKHLRSLADNGDCQAQLVLRGIASCSGPRGSRYETPQYTVLTNSEVRARQFQEQERRRLRMELQRRLQ